MSCCERDDAIDEEHLILCCAACCANVSLYPRLDALGCSGKAGICCINAECCCKPGAPLLFPLGCLGLRMENDGCSILNLQCHTMCLVCSAAIPCNKEVPVAVTIAGLTLFPTIGCCIKQKNLRMDR